MGPAPDTFLYWLVEAARRLRTLQDRKAPDVGFWAGDASSVYRFEQRKGWPRDPDRMVNAYAKECGLDDARELWRLALELWAEHGEKPDLETLRPGEQRTPLGPADLLEAARTGFEQSLADAAPEPRADARPRARKSASKGSRRATG